MDKDKRDYIAAWLKKGEHDLQTVSIIMDALVKEKPFDTVCFHCQQAAEKYLKAYLVFLDVSFPKTHIIAQLIELGAKKDDELRSLAGTDELTSYGTDIRYPDDFNMPSEDDA
jgi:HEPN domain-containing protein